MSENKPNWVDKANLASNLLQNVQLQQLHSLVRVLGNLQAEQVRMELNERQTRERENRLREGLWVIENGFNRLLNDPGITKCAMCVLAGQIQDLMAKSGLTTDSFRQLDDKDRLARFLDRLEGTGDSIDKLSAEERAKVAEYRRCDAEAQELTALISWRKRTQQFKRRRNEVTAKRRTLDELRRSEGTRVENAGRVRSFLERLAGSVSAQSKAANELQAQIERLEKGINEDEAQEPLSNQQRLKLSRKYAAKSVRALLTQKKEREDFMARFRHSNGLPTEDYFEQNSTSLQNGIAGEGSRVLLSAEVQELARHGEKKIAAIKLYREQTGAGIAEAKEAVEAFMFSENHRQRKT